MRYLLFVLLTLSCHTAKKSLKDQKMIEGNWCLVEKGPLNEINYGHIHFSTLGTITLSSRADTVFFYGYRIEKNNLLITRRINQDTIKAPIIKLNRDSLVFSSLIEKRELQTYYRCKNQVNPYH